MVWLACLLLCLQGDASDPHQADPIHPSSRKFSPDDLRKRLTSQGRPEVISSLSQQLMKDPKQLANLLDLASKFTKTLPGGQLPKDLDLKKLEPQFRKLAEQLANDPVTRDQLLNDPKIKELGESLLKKYPDLKNLGEMVAKQTPNLLKPNGSKNSDPNENPAGKKQGQRSERTDAPRNEGTQGKGRETKGSGGRRPNQKQVTVDENGDPVPNQPGRNDPRRTGQQPDKEQLDPNDLREETKSGRQPIVRKNDGTGELEPTPNNPQGQGETGQPSPTRSNDPNQGTGERELPDDFAPDQDRPNNRTRQYQEAIERWMKDVAERNPKAFDEAEGAEETGERMPGTFGRSNPGKNAGQPNRQRPEGELPQPNQQPTARPKSSGNPFGRFGDSTKDTGARKDRGRRNAGRNTSREDTAAKSGEPANGQATKQQQQAEQAKSVNEAGQAMESLVGNQQPGMMQSLVKQMKSFTPGDGQRGLGSMTKQLGNLTQSLGMSGMSTSQFRHLGNVGSSMNQWMRTSLGKFAPSMPNRFSSWRPSSLFGRSSNPIRSVGWMRVGNGQSLRQSINPSNGGMIAVIIVVGVVLALLLSSRQVAQRFGMTSARSLQLAQAEDDRRDQIRFRFESTAISLIGPNAFHQHHHDIQQAILAHPKLSREHATEVGQLVDLYELARYRHRNSTVTTEDVQNADRLAAKLLTAVSIAK